MSATAVTAAAGNFLQTREKVFQTIPKPPSIYAGKPDI